jgi:hypothetical protein
MLKTTDAPKNKNVENTCIFNISDLTKQYVIYASSILLFIMRYPLLHVTSESKMNSNNQGTIYTHCRLFQNQNSKQFCFFPPRNSWLHMTNKRRSLVSHGKHTQFLCLFSSKSPIRSAKYQESIGAIHSIYNPITCASLFGNWAKTTKGGPKRRVGYKSSTLKNETLRYLEMSNVSLFRYGAMSINVKFRYGVMSINVKFRYGATSINVKFRYGAMSINVKLT